MSRCFSMVPYVAFLLGAVAVATGPAPKVSAAPVDSGVPVDAGADAQAITLDYENAPPAKVEMSLSFGLFSEMFGITDAALQGVVDAATRFASGANADEKAAIELTTEQIVMAKKVLGILRGSIKSLEVRVYEDTEAAYPAMKSYYSGRIAKAGWDRVLRVAEGNKTVELAIRRENGAIRGAFVMASDGRDDMVIALLGCDLSPKKVRELTDTVTSAAFELGIAKELEKAMAEMQREIKSELK